MIQLKRAEIHLTMAGTRASTFVLELEDVSLESAKNFAGNWLEMHRFLCEVDGCGLYGWEVWATRFGVVPKLMSRFPERV